MDVLCTVLKVAEMANHEELVGVVRGCIKKLGFSLRSSHLKMGCILGLRVSPRHRCSLSFITFLF